jgi:hypothetical protein
MTELALFCVIHYLHIHSLSVKPGCKQLLFMSLNKVGFPLWEPGFSFAEK